MKEKYRRIHTSRTFRRFALSFLAVLILPVAIFSFLFLNNFYRIYQDKLIEQAQNSLDATMMELERELQGLRNIANYNSQFGYMESYAIRKNYTSKEIIDALSADVATHSVLENIFYYDTENPGTVYSAGGTYSLHYFARFYMGEGEEGKLSEMLSSLNTPQICVWNKNAVEKNLPNPYYVFQRGIGKWWLFSLSQKTLLEILNTDNGVTVLLDAEGNHIFPFDQAAEYAGSSQYYKITSKSPDGNFMLVRTISKESLFADLYKWQNYFFVMLAAVLLTGSMLIFFLSSYNEKPIRELQYYCKEKVRNIPVALDGFEMFRFVMNKMEEQVSLNEEKQQQKKLLLQLIFGWECDTAEFHESLKAADIFLHAKNYRVIVALSSEIAASSKNERETHSGKLEMYLKTQAGAGFEYRIVDIASENFVVIIVGMSQDTAQKLEQELSKIIHWFQVNVNCNLYFGVGENCEVLSKIHQSYLGAVSLNLKQCQESGKQIIYSKPGKKSGKSFLYPDKELHALYDALVEADFDNAKQLTDVLTDMIKEQEDNRILYTSLYYDVLNTYYKAQSKLALNTESAVLDISLLEIKDNSDAIRMIRRIREQFKVYIGSAEEAKREKHVISKVLAFIDENSKSCDLSVSIVADYFNMSISNLSHQFKMQTNRKISDYINDKKFEYAAELLLRTDYRVSEIAEMLGYAQSTNFTRKFKQYFGITPGEYRNREGDGEKSNSSI